MKRGERFSSFIDGLFLFLHERKNAKMSFKHCYPAIEYLLSLDGKTFQLAYPKDPEGHREKLLELRNKGFKSISCDNSDPKTGECLGHDDE